MATLTVKKSGWAGSVSMEAKSANGATGAVGGDVFANDGNTYLLIINAQASTRVINIASVNVSNFGVDTDLSLTLAASFKGVLGPFATNRFNDANGNVSLTYGNSGNDGADLTITPFRPANGETGQ